MLFRKNLTVCSKPLTFEKIGKQEIDQNLLIRLRRGGAVVPRLRASFRWYLRFLQGKLTERALQKDGNGDGPSAGVMRQTMLSVASELKQIDNAIAVAKSLALSLEAQSWPARLQGKYAHDRFCEKAQAAGVELNLVLYDFRHTLATRMAGEGIQLPTLAKILGHSSIRIVERYVHPFIRRLSTRRATVLRYEAAQMART
jgi:hypothetical protein